MTIAWIGTRNTSIAILAGLAAVLVAGLFTVAGANPSNGLPTSPNPYICDESKRGLSVSFNHGGYVYWGFHCGSADLVRDLNGNPIPSDAPEPGVLMEQSSGQGLVGVYEGETRRNIANAPKGPLIYRGNPQYGTVVWASSDGNHRTVISFDGKHYREERIRGRWVRSNAYKNSNGPIMEQRSALWNTYYRCRGENLRSMNLWFGRQSQLPPKDCS